MLHLRSTVYDRHAINIGLGAFLFLPQGTLTFVHTLVLSYGSDAVSR